MRCAFLFLFNLFFFFYLLLSFFCGRGWGAYIGGMWGMCLRKTLNQRVSDYFFS